MNNRALDYQLNTLQCIDAQAITQLFKILKQEPNLEKGLDWINENQPLHKAYVLDEGWAIRYKLLEDGRRQILNFLIPGDLIGYFSLLFNTSAYSVEPITALSTQSFTASDAMTIFKQSPQLAIALSWLAAQAERQLDEQIVRIGRRSAQERMAHLFIELYYRLRRTNRSIEQASHLPLNQTLLADALGMSHIHTHRSFKALHKANLVTIKQGSIVLLDTQKLSQLAGFDASYLEQVSLPGNLAKNFI